MAQLTYTGRDDPAQHSGAPSPPHRCGARPEAAPVARARREGDGSVPERVVDADGRDAGPAAQLCRKLRDAGGLGGLRGELQLVLELTKLQGRKATRVELLEGRATRVKAPLATGGSLSHYQVPSP